MNIAAFSLAVLMIVATAPVVLPLGLLIFLHRKAVEEIKKVYHIRR